MIDLDLYTNTYDWVEPEGETKNLKISESSDQVTKHSSDLGQE